MADLRKEAMGKGIQESAFVILFLSQGTLARPYVRFELGEALKYEKTILLMHLAGGQTLLCC